MERGDAMLVRCERCGVEVEVLEEEVRLDRRVLKLTGRRQWSCYCTCGEALVRDVEMDGQRVRILPASKDTPAVTHEQIVARSLAAQSPVPARPA
jgi:hypothetical protein